MSENRTFKKISLRKLNEGETISCRVERIVQGRYGRQPVVTINGVECFLPGHTQLIRKVEEIGLRKPIKVTLVKNGHKTKETEYRVEVAR